MTRPDSRRRWTRLALFAAFIVVPLIEIYVLIQVGQVIGPWWTILLLILDSLFGTWLIRREGGRAWQALRAALESGRMPARELADGALILVGGTLMLTPGFVTDAFGILLILPVTRPVARRLLTQVVTRRLMGAERTRPGPGPGGPVIRGEVVEDYLAGLLLPGRRAVQVSGTDLAAAQQLQTLLEDVLELLLGAPLEQHVPVRAGGLLVLGLGLDPGGAQCLAAALLALPGGRDLGLDRHRDLELVPIGAQVSDLLTSRELDAALVLEALTPQSSATQCSLRHEPPPG